MRKRRPIVLALVVVAVLGATVLIRHPWPPRLGDHFGFPLPATATLVNYHHSMGVFDSGHEFAFAVTDGALRDAIIAGWHLAAPADGADVLDFAQNTGEPWWPRAKLDTFPEKYGRVDEGAGRYWSLWVDRQNGTLYAEYGNW